MTLASYEETVNAESDYDRHYDLRDGVNDESPLATRHEAKWTRCSRRHA